MGDELKTTSDDLPQNAEDQQTTELNDDLDLGAFVEGFEDEGEFHDDTGDEVEDNVDTDDGEHGDADDRSDIQDADEEPEKDDLSAKVDQLQAHIVNLNKALHESRQKLKAKKKDTDSAEQLTETQLDQLFTEHKDDPQTLRRLVQYVAEQAAKKGKTEAVDATEMARQKTIHDNFVYTHWPALAETDSQLRVSADAVKGQLNIDDHPMGDYLAMGAMLIDQLPQLQKAAYEKGKADSLKGAANAKRKSDVRNGKLAPSGKRGSGKSGPQFSDADTETINRLELTPSQQKIYAKLRGKKGL